MDGLISKAVPTADWMIRVFGSVEAWKKSRTRCRFVTFGCPHHRQTTIPPRLIPARRRPLPRDDRPVSDELRAAVAHSVTGVGPRPRLEYEIGGERRIAIGRRGEPLDRLRADIVATYGLVRTVEVLGGSDALAEYVANGSSYRPYARSLRVRHKDFLAMAADPAQIERAVVLSDRQLERVWRLNPVCEMPGEELSLSHPGGWAHGPKEVVIGDPGGKAERPAPLPMAVPKADGNGKRSRYFGYELSIGGGARWRLRDFYPPLMVALGGRLNRELGFGGSVNVDEVVPYVGDGYHWGRNKPLAPRANLGREVGPVCRVLLHPPPAGDWYTWLGQPFPLQKGPSTHETWRKRQKVYERERNNCRKREAESALSDPHSEGRSSAPHTPGASFEMDEAA